ncbi:hypothetical protein [Psychrobacter sp.]|uniref:hypothetical protein n=1 Tax=Psychrobacter sp. TaxID=56811 RepID=UPI0025DD9819|nr:hypothetical protein [Psychrobacter sp.]
MNTIYPKLICLSLVFISTISFGCMPFPPSSTLLGRLQGVEPTSHVQSYTSDRANAHF